MITEQDNIINEVKPWELAVLIARSVDKAHGLTQISHARTILDKFICCIVWMNKTSLMLLAEA